MPSPVSPTKAARHLTCRFCSRSLPRAIRRPSRVRVMGRTYTGPLSTYSLNR